MIGLFATLVLAVSLFGGACKATPAEPTQPTPPSVDTPAVAPAAPTSPAPPTATLNSEAAARAFVERWCAVQNQGDFEAYRQLYAERFRGTKRAGPRVRHFDHDAWLRDRARMFRQTMHVEASDVTVELWSHGTMVRFTQAWSSPTFADVGRKELLLVEGPAGLQIASEVMLASDVARQAVLPKLDASEFRFLARTNHLYVVVSAAGEDAWATGHPQLDAAPSSDVSAARRHVNVAKVPTELRSSVPSQLALYGVGRRVCTATVGELYLLRRVVVHFGTRGIWSGQSQDFPGPPPSDAVIARDIWREADRTLLVADLTATEGACEGALWARSADKPEPVLFEREELSATDERAALVNAAVTRVPAYQEIAASYRTFRTSLSPQDRGAARWEDFDGAAANIAIWRGGGRTLLTFEGASGGCGDFGAELHVIFEQRGEELVAIAHHAGSFELDTIFDANGDTTLEVLGSGFFMRATTADVITTLREKSLSTLDEVTPPFHDCGC